MMGFESSEEQFQKEGKTKTEAENQARAFLFLYCFLKLSVVLWEVGGQVNRCF